MTRTSFLGRLDALLQTATATELVFADIGHEAPPATPRAHRAANQSHPVSKAA